MKLIETIKKALKPETRTIAQIMDDDFARKLRADYEEEDITEIAGRRFRVEWDVREFTSLHVIKGGFRTKGDAFRFAESTGAVYFLSPIEVEF